MTAFVDKPAFTGFSNKSDFNFGSSFRSLTNFLPMDSLNDPLTFPNNITMNTDEGLTSNSPPKDAAIDEETNPPIPQIVLPFFSTQSNKKKKALPQDFTPGEKTVLCGRSRECTESPGNLRFKKIVHMYLKEYQQATDKLEKSFIVSKIVNVIREDSAVGAFVKLENGQWFEVSDRCAREKVGALFRDLLHTDYKSSTKNKVARRRQQDAPQIKKTGHPPKNQSDQSGDISEASSCVSMADVEQPRTAFTQQLQARNPHLHRASFPHISSFKLQTGHPQLPRVSLNDTGHASFHLQAGSPQMPQLSLHDCASFQNIAPTNQQSVQPQLPRLFSQESVSFQTNAAAQQSLINIQQPQVSLHDSASFQNSTASLHQSVNSQFTGSSFSDSASFHALHQSLNSQFEGSSYSDSALFQNNAAAIHQSLNSQFGGVSFSDSAQFAFQNTGSNSSFTSFYDVEDLRPVEFNVEERIQEERIHSNSPNHSNSSGNNNTSDNAGNNCGDWKV